MSENRCLMRKRTAYYPFFLAACEAEVPDLWGFRRFRRAGALRFGVFRLRFGSERRRLPRSSVPAPYLSEATKLAEVGRTAARQPCAFLAAHRFGVLLPIGMPKKLN